MLNKKFFRLIKCEWVLMLTIVIAIPILLSAEESENLIDYHSEIYYTIKKGDTLWDLSEKFLNSPWQWPALWHKNNQIINPHLIYPGNRIRLSSREEMKNLDDNTDKHIEKTRSITNSTAYYTYSSMHRIGFIKADPVSPCGFIFKAKDDKEMISTMDIVYIQQDGTTPLIPGNSYTVYRTLKSIKDNETGADFGIQYFLTGVIEIIKKESQFYVAQVMHSFRTIKVNDLLMPYDQPESKIILQENKKGLEGKIIASEEHEGIFGDNTVAFINKGNRDGVAPGQFYSIYYQEKAKVHHQFKEEVFLPPVDIGKFLVLRAEDSTSTVLITNSSKSIYPGAKFRSTLSLP
ncbi:MAG: LysM peptidoglycan-binding domain-containing protein [Desulfobacterales bacterium]|nr:LysM peptidoglycan-binding domain-containing protein [Desulfobacterales bacterium]